MGFQLGVARSSVCLRKIFLAEVGRRAWRRESAGDRGWVTSSRQEITGGSELKESQKNEREKLNMRKIK